MVKVAVLSSVIRRPIVTVIGGGQAKVLKGISTLRNLFEGNNCQFDAEADMRYDRTNESESGAKFALKLNDLGRSTVVPICGYCDVRKCILWTKRADNPLQSIV